MDLKQREEAARKLAASVKEAIGRIMGTGKPQADGKAEQNADKPQPSSET